MGLPISSLTFSSTVVNGQAEAAGLSSRDTTKGADGKGHGAMGGAGTSSPWCRGLLPFEMLNSRKPPKSRLTCAR